MILKKTHCYGVFKTQCDSLKSVKKKPATKLFVGITIRYINWDTSILSFCSACTPCYERIAYPGASFLSALLVWSKILWQLSLYLCIYSSFLRIMFSYTSLRSRYSCRFAAFSAATVLFSVRRLAKLRSRLFRERLAASWKSKRIISTINLTLRITLSCLGS